MYKDIYIVFEFYFKGFRYLFFCSCGYEIVGNEFNLKNWKIIVFFRMKGY